MTLTIRSILVSLSALLVTGTLTACDSADELEALGVDIEDLDNMTPEELDELPCFDELDLAAPPPARKPPVPRPQAPARKLAAAGPDAAFFDQDDLLASDKLGLPDDGDDTGCDTNGDDDIALAAN
jgi:hypothetical protein